MDAMSYEFLLRRIYQVERRGKDGADADVYRKMELAGRTYDMDIENIKNKVARISTMPIEELRYEYKVQCRKVWRYVENAIEEGLNQHKYLMSQEEIKELENSIIEPEVVFKEHIDNAVKTAERIFAAHKINLA